MRYSGVEYNQTRTTPIEAYGFFGRFCEWFKKDDWAMLHVLRLRGAAVLFWSTTGAARRLAQKWTTQKNRKIAKKTDTEMV